MTTRITVTTGDGGLLERNAQQQAANRQGTLVKAQAEQAAATGAEQQRQRRIASGLDPATGRPLPSVGSTSRLTRIDQEPAAFRSGVASHILWFPTEPTFDIQLLNGGGSPASLYMRLTETYPVYRGRIPIPGRTYAFQVQHPTHTSGVSYLPAGGPYGEPAMLVESPQAVGFFTPSTFINIGTTLLGINKQFSSFTTELDYAADNDALQISETISGFDQTGSYVFNAQFRLLCYENISIDPELFLVVQITDAVTSEQTLYAFINFEPLPEIRFLISDLNVWNRIAFTCTPAAAYLLYNGVVFKTVPYSSPLTLALDPATFGGGATFEHSNGTARVRKTKLCAFAFTPGVARTSNYTPRSLVR